MLQRPNILFLITHDVGHQYGCFGNDQVQTPNIDRFSEDAMIFDNHYCHWPLCGPARSNLFSGCRPLTTRRFGNDAFMGPFRERMGGSFATIPEHFRNNGYETGAAGLVFHDDIDPPSWSLGHWFPDPEDMFRGRKAVSGDLPDRLLARWQCADSMHIIRERWEKLQADGFTEEDLKEGHIARRTRGPAVERGDSPLGDMAYEGGHIAAHTREMLRRMPEDRPFFFAAGFIDPHLPFMSPAKYWDLYDRSQLRLPPFRKPPENTTEWAQGDCEAAQYCTTHGYEEPWLPTDEESLELLHGRLAVLSYYDALIGGILDTLEETGRADNTIVVFTSDHGFHDGEHGYWGKHNLWDRSMHAPLMIRLPESQRRAGCVSGYTEHVDIYPTLCELAGLDRPGDFLEGDSMASLFEDPGQPFKQAVFAHRKHVWHDRIMAYDLGSTVRTPRYRFTEYMNEAGEVIHTELFDYEADPLETRNHADEAEYAGTRKELKALLAAGWQEARPEL